MGTNGKVRNGVGFGMLRYCVAGWMSRKVSTLGLVVT